MLIGGKVLGGLKGTVAIPQQNANRTRSRGEIKVGGDDIENAVASEIADFHGSRIRASGVLDAGLESPVAVARQNADGVFALIGDDQIEIAVGIEVAHGHFTGKGAAWISDGRLKSSVAVAQKHV